MNQHIDKPISEQLVALSNSEFLSDTANVSNLTIQQLPILFDALNLTELPDHEQQQIVAIDACLPQTQCGLCDHPEGCLPYAVAIVTQNEAHNKCVPGGQVVSDTIARLMGRPLLTAVKSKWSVDPISLRPKEVRAVIREEDCIGCTKCIPACPVDAIIGTGKHMHTVFTDLCTGCELCIAPCPVDCIDLVEAERTLDLTEQIAEQNDLRHRYYTHLDRVAAQMQDGSNAKPVISMVESKLGNITAPLDINADMAKSTIAAAKLRTKIKKLKRQLAVRTNQAKLDELASLETELKQLNN